MLTYSWKTYVKMNCDFTNREQTVHAVNVLKDNGIPNIKGILHSKMKILQSITYAHVAPKPAKAPPVPGKHNPRHPGRKPGGPRPPH